MTKPQVFHKILKLVSTLSNFTLSSPRSSIGVLSNTYLDLDNLAIICLDAKNAGTIKGAYESLIRITPYINKVSSHLHILMNIRGVSINQLGVLTNSLEEVITDIDKWRQSLETKLKSGNLEVKAV